MTIPPSPVARFWSLVTGLLWALGGCHGANEGTLPAEDRLFERLMEEYVTERFRFYPVESTLAGLPGNDDRLGSYSSGDIEARIQWLSDFHQKLAGLRPTELSEPAYLDASWLTSLVKAERFELEERKLWSRTASFYADKGRVGIIAILVDSELPSRGGHLEGRLSAIPDLLAQARENLSPGADLWRRDGLTALELFRGLLRDLPELLEDRLAPPRVAELAHKSRVAIRSVQELQAFLSETPLDGNGRVVALGPERLGRYFRYHEMVDRPPGELAERALHQVERAENRMMELALNYAPAPLADLIRGGATATKAEVEAEIGQVRAFLSTRGVEQIPRAVPVRSAPYYFTAPERIRLWRPAALEPARGAFLMVSTIEAPEADAPPLDTAEAELATLREVAGRYRMFANQSESTSLLRRVFAARTTSEGWLRFYEAELLRVGYDAGDHELRLRHLHRALLDALRLLAAVRFHADGRELSEVERLFRERGFLSASEARAEARRVVVDPGAGSGALGFFLLEDLADDYFRSHPLASSFELSRRMLSEGLLPLRLLRFALLPPSALVSGSG